MWVAASQAKQYPLREVAEHAHHRRPKKNDTTQNISGQRPSPKSKFHELITQAAPDLASRNNVLPTYRGVDICKPQIKLLHHILYGTQMQCKCNMNAKQYESTIAQIRKSSMAQMKHSEEDCRVHWNDL